MRLFALWTGAVLALSVVAGSASAEATAGRSSEPTAVISAQFASLLGTEHKILTAVPETRLTALATGSGEAGSPQDANAKAPYTEKYLASLPAPKGGAGWNCLREALYFEARGESIKGEFAVAEVVLNRLDSPLFPNTICAVVKQTGDGGCAFSWYCDGKSDVMYDKTAEDRAGRIAWLMMQKGQPRPLTSGATYFHSRAVKPNWGHDVIETAAIGSHLFFRQP